MPWVIKMCKNPVVCHLWDFNTMELVITASKLHQNIIGFWKAQISKFLWFVIYVAPATSGVSWLTPS